MPIIFDQERKIFKLDSDSTSYCFAIGPYGYLLHLYYGARIPDTELAYLSYTCRHASQLPRVQMDEPEYFSKDISRMEYPCNGCGDFRSAALTVRRACGTADTDITYVSHRIYAGKPPIPGQPSVLAGEADADTLEVSCRDDATGAEVMLFYTVFRNLGAMTRRTVVRNGGEEPIDVLRVMSLCNDYHDARDMDLIHLWGNWGRECTFERAPLLHATQSVSSKRGLSSHAHNPFLALCSHDATEESGEAYGFNLVYSGNFLASAEMDSDGGARVLMGINPENFTWHLEPGEQFESPEAVSAFSDCGLGGMSRIFHRLYRDHLCRSPWAHKPRPILVNNWEATYFQFDSEKLLEIAKTAAGLGIEMLVMDDGWFGDRNSVRSGLGDWTANEEKLRGGLPELVKNITALGLKFGIWFEPEMVSADSKLYRAHPDWVLETPGRRKSISRYQYVLDMSRPEVRDYLFNSISAVLDSAPIAYVKWDCNRSLTEVGSALLDAPRGQEAFHRYVLGLYALLDRVTTAYPDLLLEGCASGGGRFDPAWLSYAPQIWTSDNTDAMERLNIQCGTSLCYPMSAMGAHVSACPNHQVHRTTELATRGAVAMAGVLGYELDLTKLTEDEKEEIRRQCREYHRDWALVVNGDFYRLLPPWKGKERCAWGFVSQDKREALVTYVVRACTVYERHYLRLSGLAPELRYLCEETGQVLSGKTWMSAGLCIRDSLYDGSARRFHLTALAD